MKRLVVLTLLMGSMLTATAQEVQVDSTIVNDLQEVVLTATRTERQLSSLPLPVTLVSQKTIQQSGTVRLNEILNEQTGIITVSDESGFEGLQIQGISSEYILILVDGVPLVGRNAGNFDLSRLTVGNIKQVEVVKGPSSSLYGSEALGGVVNIITEKPEGRDLNGGVSYRLGSYTQQDINLEVDQQLGKLRYALFANRFSSEGYDLNSEAEGQTVNPFENYTVNGRLYYDLNDKLSLFASARLYEQEQDAGLNLNDTNFEGSSDETEWNAHTRLDHEWNDRLRFSYEFYATNYKAEEFIADPIGGEVLSQSDFDQFLLRPEVRMHYDVAKKASALPKTTLTAGVGWQYDQLNRTFFDGQVQFNSQYVYAQYDTHLGKRFNVIGGLRFDHHSEYNEQVSPKLALRYRLNDHWSLKGSVGYGFKAPDFRQLYFDFTNSAVGYTVLGYNVAIDKLAELEAQGQISDVVVSYSALEEPLRAESSVGYNLGTQFRKGRFLAELNFFRNDFSNLIDTRIIARKTNGQNVFSYVNFDAVYTTGAEVNTEVKVSDRLTISGGYQLLYAYDKAKREAVREGSVFARDSETNETVQLGLSDYFGLINRSRHNANLKFFYTLPTAKADLNLRLVYRSRYAQFDTNGNDLIDRFDNSFVEGFMLTHLAASKTFKDRVNLQVGVNNLLNVIDPNIPSQPGRLLFAKINYQF